MVRIDPLYSYFHTRARMEERYGYKGLSILEYKEMCNTCREKGIKIKKEYTPKGYQYIYRIIFKGIKIVVVYATWDKRIKTVLPLQHFKRIGSTKKK